VKLVCKPNGLILLTGPTGSGKTTAIYSALYMLVQKHGPAISIATVEDPVEFSLPMVARPRINLAQEFTYPKALRSLMRQDPQVIMVGEIRRPGNGQHRGASGADGPFGHQHDSQRAARSGVFARLINMNIEPFLAFLQCHRVLGRPA